MYLLALALLPLALAQYGPAGGDQTTSSSMTATSSAASATASSSTVHSVDVGNGGLLFQPNSVTAKMGETVEFHFYPKNHSVAQSSFASPCVPLMGGFYSGFQPALNGENSRIFILTVNDTNPIWVYCSQATHCQSGMAMVINPPSSGPNTLDAYKTAAKAAQSQTQSPANVAGGVFGESSGGNASSTSAAGSGTATSSATAKTTSNVASGKHLEWSTVGITGLGALLFGGVLM